MKSEVNVAVIAAAARRTAWRTRPAFFRRGTLAICLCGWIGVVAPVLAEGLISVDFGPQIADTHDFSGVEANAAAANALFSAANVWNPLRVADFDQPTTTNPTFNSLKDSTGSVTSVSFGVSGSVNGFDFVSFYGAAPADALRHDMLFFVGRGTTPTIDWVISGLVASTEYRFYAYGTRADTPRLFDMWVDTDGNGLFTDEASQALGSTGNDMQHYQDAYFASVYSDATGAIHGRGVGRTDVEANWSGFQLVQAGTSSVPEPGSLALLAIGFAGLAASRRRAPPRSSFVR